MLFEVMWYLNMASLSSFLCVDVNECDIYQCHNCSNSDGSFNCSCDAGYKLVDSSMCQGTVRLQPFALSLCYHFLSPVHTALFVRLSVCLTPYGSQRITSVVRDWWNFNGITPLGRRIQTGMKNLFCDK